MIEKLARGHVMRDPRPTRDLGGYLIDVTGVGLFEKLVVTDEDAQQAAYDGYPDVIKDIQQNAPE